MTRFLLVVLGGAAGTAVRYGVGLGATSLFGKDYPVGTITVNLLGCFLMALVMHTALETTLLSETARLVLTTGFMGGLTTYSAFNWEVTSLSQSRAPLAAAVYLAVTVLGCLLAGLAGAYVSRRLAA